MRKCGVEYVETRLVWCYLEKKPGEFDWSRVDRDVARIERFGMRPALFVWPQHMPRWADLVRLKCLEHQQESDIPSLWDEHLLEHYDRVYGETARHFGDRLQFLYFGLYGDYGEFMYPAGVRHYLFSPRHNHGGMWCGDKAARASFRQCMRRKYGDIQSLNVAWETDFASFDQELMEVPQKCSKIRCLDLNQWYCDSLTDFSDKACATIRRHFPKIRGAMPIGSVRDIHGEIKSEAVRLCAKYGLTARWTGWAHLGAFGYSDVLAKRISSAARFYGCPFGVESALELYADNAANAVYEALANGATLVHNDVGNYLRAPEVYRQLKELLKGEQPMMDAGVYYPLENELLSEQGGDMFLHEEHPVKKGFSDMMSGSFEGFLEEMNRLRKTCDYELADSLMIARGFLRRVRRMYIPSDALIPRETAHTMEAWARNGGELLFMGEARILETGEPWQGAGKRYEWKNAEGQVYVTQFASGKVCFDPSASTIY